MIPDENMDFHTIIRQLGKFSQETGESFRKKGLKKMEETVYKGESSEYLVQFAKSYLETHPDINFFIFGHRHIMLDLMLSRTSRILIAGDWMQYFSYIVWDGENLFLDQFEAED